MEVAVFQRRLRFHQLWVVELQFTPLTGQAGLSVCCGHLKYEQTAASSREA